MVNKTTNSELEAKRAKLQMERLKEYFRNVIAKQDFNFEEYSQKAAEWKQLTGSEFDYDILLDKSRQDVLRPDETIVDQEVVEAIDNQIVENLNTIDSIYKEKEVKKHLDGIVQKADEQVEIVDDAGEKVEAEASHKLLSSLMTISMQEVGAMYADDKNFSRKNKDEQRESLLDDIERYFNTKTAAAVVASAIDVKDDEKTAAKKSHAAAQRYMSGAKVTIKKGHIIDAISSSILSIKDKIAKLKNCGLAKSADKIKNKLKSFITMFNKEHREALKDGLVQDMKTNPTQWITTAVTTGVMAATAFASAPVALGAAAGYAVYTAASTPLWNLNRKRNTELRKDVAFAKFIKSKQFSDNELKTLQNKKSKAFDQLNAQLNTEFEQSYYPALKNEWKGWKGMKKAWMDIHANPEEKKDFNDSWKFSTGISVACAGILGALAPSVIGAANIGTKTAEAAATNAMSMARFGTGLVRVLGGNANAYYNKRKAEKRFEKTQSAEDKARLEGAKTGLAWTALLTSAVEAFAVSGAVANASAHPGMADVAPTGNHGPFMHNGEYTLADYLQNHQNDTAPWMHDYGTAGNVTDAPVVGAEVAPEPSSVAIPTEYDKAAMGITHRQWEYIHTEVTPMHIGNFDETYLNAANAQAAHPELFVHPDGSPMTTEETMWEASRILSLAKARPDGHGGLIARFWDPNGQEVYANGNHEFFYDKGMTKPVEPGVECLPRCHGDEKTVKAFQDLYKMINCGKAVKEVDGTRIKQFFDETMSNGQYKGEGWNIGVTNNVMDRDGCDDIHFIRGKPIAPKAPDVTDQPPATTVREDGSFDHVKVEKVTAVDAQADQAEVTDNISLGTTATDHGSNDVNDPKSLQGTKPGETKPLSGTTRVVTPKSGGRSDY
ncbi:MAG: hypothetical protein J6N49_04680 [Alphaproteobacteria bacterium]|nr:hypothetical protein [Alphaproteobacteria bacterium]